MSISWSYYLWLAVVTGRVFGACTQLHVLPDAGPQCVFGNATQTITVFFHNAGQEQFEADLTIRRLQTTSATLTRLSEIPWKTLQVLPGQTIVESAEISFPNVRAETRFLIQWLDGTNRVLGTTEVFVYPTNLLGQLKLLAGEERLGVFDPANQFKPLLKQFRVPHQDLVEDGTDKFHGKLAIFGPFDSKLQMRVNLADDIRALAKRGVMVVWLQPPPAKHAPLQPSFYTVRIGNGAIVVAQAVLVLRLGESPQAQLNLIHLAEAAIHPAPLDLPQVETSH
ncbi:MAG: hypothetical protein HY298_26595 [Verrucomicrobia bacterium]|nr:hypothetical protein [Verrucomicrobiota bacterium]